MPCKTKEEKRKRALEYYYNNKSKVLEYQKNRWHIKYFNDVKFREKRQLRDRSRIGKKNLEGEICKLCGTNKDLQRHHINYNIHYFEILCRKCHNELHNALREIDCQSAF
jgi:hypothetical protein